MIVTNTPHTHHAASSDPDPTTRGDIAVNQLPAGKASALSSLVILGRAINGTGL